MVTKRIVLVAGLIGGAAALVAIKPTKPICGIICIDGKSECGVGFGGCYDPCLEPAPTPPPCATPPTPYLSTWYPTPVPTPTTPEVANCSTIIVCVDGINSCGIPFGACIPDCKPWNIFTPPCPIDDILTLPLGAVPWNPATGTPALETPILVTPGVEIPFVEGPILVTPTLDTPILVTPTVEPAILQTPAVEILVTEAPIAEGPVPWIPGPGGFF
ncbi:hypothetical protein V8C42DRAFT_317690 [Trichoderma barbatum]